MMGDSVITVRGLRKSYGAHEAALTLAGGSARR